MDLDLDGVWIGYLEVGLAVVRDVERVRTTLNEFLRREAVPLYIQGHVKAWLESLDQVAGDLKAAPSLARARELFTQATALTLVPAGRERARFTISLHQASCAACWKWMGKLTRKRSRNPTICWV